MVCERVAMLVVISGLPATGKSTVCRRVAREMSAPYVRIDTLEQAIADAGGAEAADGTLGYRVGYAMAEDLLRQGFTVFAESVNPLQVTRTSWRATAERVGVPWIEVEFVCSDPREHERRVEGRTVDVPGLEPPDWHDVGRRVYETWDRAHPVIDTAGRAVADSVARLRTVLAP